ncbi:MAG: hypothetical protein HOO99_03890 [Hyphomicrobiaceae bacterium]|nr:hypothetical protein [Hyphomicrobiaceae bacterium]
MKTITRDDLARMYPRAQSQWIEAFVALAPMLMVHYRFNRFDWCGMCGQIDAECDGLALARMEENMSMDAKSILRLYSFRLNDAMRAGPVFGKRYSSKEALARDLAHNSKKLADVVYGGPHGREGTPPWQGSLYPGRGPLQETHLNNYKAARDEIRNQPGGEDCPDLVENPEVLADRAEMGVRDIFAQWKLKRLSRYAQVKDWSTLSDALNTGNVHDSVKPHGLPRRLRATARALAIWPDEFDFETPGNRLSAIAFDPNPAKTIAAREKTRVAAANAVRLGDSGAEVKRLQARLCELGFAVGATDGDFGTLTKRALVAFQAEHELAPTGVADAATWEVLAASAPADLGARASITATDLAAAGSETIAVTQRAKWWSKWTQRAGLGGVLDQYFDLGIADTAVAKAEQVKSLMSRSGELTAGLPPVWKLLPFAPSTGLLLCLAVCLAAWGVHYVFDRIEWFRVRDARTGVHLGRGKPS